MMRFLCIFFLISIVAANKICQYSDTTCTKESGCYDYNTCINLSGIGTKFNLEGTTLKTTVYTTSDCSGSGSTASTTVETGKCIAGLSTSTKVSNAMGTISASFGLAAALVFSTLLR